MLMPDGAAQALGIDRVRAFVGRLHQAGAAATEDVAAHRRQLCSQLLHAPIGVRARFEPGRTEDGYAIVMAGRAAKARQLIDDIP